jgi:alkylation response protein AidB-like acyl-CoA dehydrogenase
MTTVDYSKMSLLRSEDVQAFQKGLRGFLATNEPRTASREQMSTVEGYDRSLWQRASAELGLAGLDVDEAHGGQAAGPIALTAAFEELGYALSGLPALSTIGLAATALAAARDSEAVSQFLPAIASGACTATLAWPGKGEQVVLDSAGRVTGRLGLVLDAHTSDLLLVVAAGPDGSALRAVTRSSDGVQSEPLATFDLTRKFAAVTLDGAESQPVGAAGDGEVILRTTLTTAGLCLASEQLGGMTRCLEDAVGHARTRVQFGRYIGSFQAVKHRCADLLVETESVRSAVHYAAWVAQAHPEELPAATAMAQSVAGDGYVNVAAATIQIHGGIGFTWEHDTHLHLKRAKAMQHFLGSPTSQRRALAASIGL